MNLAKMRKQLQRTVPCGAVYMFPTKPPEVCRKSSIHTDDHDWPSAPAWDRHNYRRSLGRP